jgi:hypothetical protein
VNGGYSSADGLGWPLHAIGDAAEPHHIAGTTSWGHRPFEDAVSNHQDHFFALGNGPGAAKSRGILVKGYWVWRKLKSGVTIDQMIQDEAHETKDRVSAESSWVYDDRASVMYNVAEVATPEVFYDHKNPLFYDLLANAAGTALGFLTYASERAANPGDDPSGFCKSGMSFSAQLAACNINPAPAVPGACESGLEASVDANGATACCPPGVISCGGKCCTDVVGTAICVYKYNMATSFATIDPTVPGVCDAKAVLK